MFTIKIASCLSFIFLVHFFVKNLNVSHFKMFSRSAPGSTAVESTCGRSGGGDPGVIKLKDREIQKTRPIPSNTKPSANVELIMIRRRRNTIGCPAHVCCDQ